MKNGYGLFDSERKSKTHPDAWEHPPQESLDQIQPGYFVKVGVIHPKFPGERFWGVVRATSPTTITVQIDQNLVCKEHGLNHQDELDIEQRHIFGIVDPRGAAVWPPDEPDA
jgi:hypothetical protein